VDLLTTVAGLVLPVAVGIIMICVGLGLEAADFRALLQPQRRRLLAVAVPCQLVLLPLPLLAWGFTRALRLPPPPRPRPR
jgi:predicted Na+-dependent transporter